MSDSSEDELDKLTRTFEEQASNDLRCLTQRQQSAKANRRRPKGMKEIREEGLQAPVPEDSKSVYFVWSSLSIILVKVYAS